MEVINGLINKLCEIVGDWWGNGFGDVGCDGDGLIGGSGVDGVDGVVGVVGGL